MAFMVCPKLLAKTCGRTVLGTLGHRNCQHCALAHHYVEPKDRRMLATWLSFDDLERLVVSALTAPIVGHTIIYGMSDNQTTWWDNTHAKHIGYRAL